MPAERFAAFFPHDAGMATKGINDGNFAALRGAGMVEGTIPSTASALEAPVQLEKSGAPGLGVVEPDGKLVGIASRGEIVKLLETRLLARQ